MNLIAFIHDDSFKKGDILKNIIDQNLENTQMQHLQTFNSLKARLKQISDYQRDIFILLADSKNRLNELTSLIDLMDDKRIILILPDRSESTTLKAHQFFPRYFTYISDTYEDLCAVIAKMSKNEK